MSRGSSPPAARCPSVASTIARSLSAPIGSMRSSQPFAHAGSMALGHGRAGDDHRRDFRMERFAQVPDDVYFRTTIGNARHAGAKRAQAIEATHAGHRDVEPQEFEIALASAGRARRGSCLPPALRDRNRTCVSTTSRLTHEGWSSMSMTFKRAVSPGCSAESAGTWTIGAAGPAAKDDRAMTFRLQQSRPSPRKPAGTVGHRPHGLAARTYSGILPSWGESGAYRSQRIRASPVCRATESQETHDGHEIQAAHRTRRTPLKGAVPEIETGGPITLFCAAVIGVCFAAPLLFSLPQTLDAAVSPAPLIRETMGQAVSQGATGAAPEPTFHERHPLQATDSWVDTLEESELATWRLRSSD